MPLAHLTATDLQRWLDATQASARVPGASWFLPGYSRQQLSQRAIAMATDSRLITAGDSDARFTLMSAIKPFLLLHLLGLHGPEVVFENIGQRPSDQPYYSARQLTEDGGIPRNPMINSGAMLMSSLLPGSTPSEQCESFLSWLNQLAGTQLSLDHEMLDSCLSEPDTYNTRLAAMLAKAGHIDDARQTYETYFRVCCLAGSVADLARLGLLLALPNPSLSRRDQATVTALTLTCGLYEASPKWAVETGLPAKSGVSGCVVAIVRGQGSLATFTPWLDEGGNPRQGLALLRGLASEHELGVF